MKKYKVSVEKSFYSTALVIVKANSPDAAILEVRKAIASGKLDSMSLTWDEHEYEYGTFDITGDVEEAGPKDKLTKIK